MDLERLVPNAHQSPTLQGRITPSEAAAIQKYGGVKDSGEREDFSTGSRRDVRTGKGRFDLLPPYAIFRVARHFENGAVKYGDRNWEKGQPLSRLMDSGIRHMFKYMAGARDEDHLAAAAWNILAAIETEYRIGLGEMPVELADLPPAREDIGW